MTIEALDAELKSLLDFRMWLREKLEVVEIDIAANDNERETLLAEMEKEYGND